MIHKAILLLFLPLLHSSSGTFCFTKIQSTKVWNRTYNIAVGFTLVDDNKYEEHSAVVSGRDEHISFMPRRRLIFQSITTCIGILSNQKVSLAANSPNLESVRSQLIEARKQLDPIPQLIREEKWDSIRAILITPPLSDCWSKTSKLLSGYALAIGAEIPDGDELAALELKEEALDHLRFLDMAVYNNVFNPIKTEGESGATKTLIRSYYEDPVNEVSISRLHCLVF